MYVRNETRLKLITHRLSKRPPILVLHMFNSWGFHFKKRLFFNRWLAKPITNPPFFWFETGCVETERGLIKQKKKKHLAFQTCHSRLEVRCNSFLLGLQQIVWSFKLLQILKKNYRYSPSLFWLSQIASVLTIILTKLVQIFSIQEHKTCAILILH